MQKSATRTRELCSRRHRRYRAVWFGILVTALSAGIGVSTVVFLLLNPRLRKRDETYWKLLTETELTNRSEIRDLVEFTRKEIARVVDNPEFSKFVAMRRWKEVVRHVFVPGEFDQGQEHGFAMMHAIYGYTDKGEECMVIGR